MRAKTPDHRGESALGDMSSRAGIEAIEGVAGIAAADDLVDEASPSGNDVEVAQGTQQQRVLDRPLGMAMGAFDRTVLMRNARVVAVGFIR